MIVLDAAFDSGSLDVKRSRVQGDVVQLVPFHDFPPEASSGGHSGGWKWLNFKVHGTRGRRLTFIMSDAFAEDAHRLDDHAMVFSEDSQRWTFFAKHEHDAHAHTYTFEHDAAFTSDTIQIAYGIPYPVSRLHDWLDTLSVKPDVIGKSPGGRELIRLRIGNGQKNVVLMSGVHPNESLAGYTLEGAVDYFLSDEAAEFRAREQASVWVYPMVNPDGRYAGLSRSTVQHPDRDANRVWQPTLWHDMADIRTIGEAIQHDTGGRMAVFVDFHCWTEARPHFALMDASRNYPDHAIWRSLCKLEPTIESVDCGTANPSTETMAILEYGAGFAMTFETMFRPGENISRLHQLGQNIARAIATS